MLSKIILSTLFFLALLIPSLNCAGVDFSKLRHRNALFPHLLGAAKSSYEADIKDIDLTQLSSRLSLYPSLAKPVKTNSNSNSNAAEERIVGGTEAGQHEFPETVAIAIDRTYFCGGIIVNSEWVLTSAACVYGASSFVVMAGRNSLLGTSTTEQTSQATEKRVHPEWTGITINSNVALLRVGTPYVFNDAVRSSRLASSEPDQSAPMTAVGWGFTSDSSVAVTPNQRKVGLGLVTDQEADDTYGDDTINYEHHICVRTAGGVGPCAQDYGGPLYSEDGTVHGAMSFHAADGQGNPLCQFGVPACYSSVTHFRSWIVANTGDNSNSAVAINGWSTLAVIVPAFVATLAARF